MADFSGMPTMPGAEALTNSLSAATKSFRGLAAEVQRMSKESLEQTSQTMEKLRGAKTVEEVVSIQTSYLQQAFASYTDNAKRFSELLMAMPMELAKQGHAAFQEGTDAAKQAVEKAGEQLNQHQG